MRDRFRPVVVGGMEHGSFPPPELLKAILFRTCGSRVDRRSYYHDFSITGAGPMVEILRTE